MLELLIIPSDMREYYCRTCSQLRLWAKAGEPATCGNCGSADILVDKAGSEVLAELRFGKAAVEAKREE